MHPKECECVECLCATSQKIYEETVGKLDQILNNTKNHEKYQKSIENTQKSIENTQKPTENIQKFINEQIYNDIKTKLNNIQTLINNDNHKIIIKHKKQREKLEEEKEEQNKVKLQIKKENKLNKLDQLTPPLKDLLILTGKYLSEMCNCNNCKCKICICKPDTILTNTKSDIDTNINKQLEENIQIKDNLTNTKSDIDINTNKQLEENIQIKNNNNIQSENQLITTTTNLESDISISNTNSIKKLTKHNCKCNKKQQQRQQISTNTDFKQYEKSCSYHRLYDNDIGVKTSFIDNKTNLIQLREKIDLCKTQLSIMNSISKNNSPINSTYTSSISTINNNNYNNNNSIKSIVTLKNKLEELNKLCIKARESNNLCKRLSELSSTSERFADNEDNKKKISVIKELENAKLEAKNAPSTVSFPSVDISDSYFKSKKMGEIINDNLPKIPYFRAVDNVYTSTPKYRYICRGGRISNGFVDF